MTTTASTGLWSNLASAPVQIGHFRNQGMWVSLKKNPEMMETDEKDKIGHTGEHTHANRYLRSSKPLLSLRRNAEMKPMGTCHVESITPDEQQHMPDA